MKTLTTKDSKQQLLKLLSLEYNCLPDDFDKEDNILTESIFCDGQRQYNDKKEFFYMVTLGSNAVITADICLHPFLKEYIKGKTGHLLFEVPNLFEIEKELNKFSYTLKQSHHMFLPYQKVDSKLDCSCKWYFGEEFYSFYGDDRFPNAICENYMPQRPDRIVVAAYNGEEIMGMAGCSEDAPGWMQIGIDVLPEFRSKGVGTHLVTLLKNKIEEMGSIPFYGTSISNYHSWNIALNSGFRPTWVEIGAKPIVWEKAV